MTGNILGNISHHPLTHIWATFSWPYYYKPPRILITQNMFIQFTTDPIQQWPTHNPSCDKWLLSPTASCLTSVLTSDFCFDGKAKVASLLWILGKSFSMMQGIFCIYFRILWLVSHCDYSDYCECKETFHPLFLLLYRRVGLGHTTFVNDH